MFDPIPARELCKFFFAKWLPPPLMIVLGVPNLLKMFLCKKLTTVLESFCNTSKYTLVVFDKFRVFCKPNLIVS